MSTPIEKKMKAKSLRVQMANTRAAGQKLMICEFCCKKMTDMETMQHVQKHIDKFQVKHNPDKMIHSIKITP